MEFGPIDLSEHNNLLNGDGAEDSRDERSLTDPSRADTVRRQYEPFVYAARGKRRGAVIPLNWYDNRDNFPGKNGSAVEEAVERIVAGFKIPNTPLIRALVNAVVVDCVVGRGLRNLRRLARRESRNGKNVEMAYSIVRRIIPAHVVGLPPFG